MIDTIKYHLNQLYHFPFDIRIGKFEFYCYKSGHKRKFTKHTGTILAKFHKWRYDFSIFGYTFDIGVRKRLRLKR